MRLGLVKFMLWTSLGCSAAVEGPIIETEAGQCQDGTDNDGDMLTDCTDPDCAPAEECQEEPETWTDPPTASLSFTPSNEFLVNPERGFYRSLSLVSGHDYQWVRDGGYSLAFSYVRLDDYRTRDLDADFLDALETGLDAARDAGIKIILRFSYNFGPYPNSEPDASKAQILRHIDQVEPILREHGDVLAIVQAGFIGAWGEWHSSTNGLLDEPQDKFDILEALLSAVPEDRFVQLRYPRYKEEGYGGPLTAAEAFSGSFQARIGHHNDCFLASDTDLGTYPPDRIEELKEFVAAETLYVPMGGETCAANPPRSDCATALEEFELLHFSYINQEWFPEVVDGWSTDGCRETIDRRLGYRLALTSAELPPQAPPGGVMPVTLRLTNEGYAAPMNDRPVTLVIDGPETHSATFEVDVRTWVPGGIELSGRFSLPASLPEGSYTVALSMPDAAATLADDPRYSVQLANAALWTGQYNQVATMTVTADAPGSVDDFTAFARLPE